MAENQLLLKKKRDAFWKRQKKKQKKRLALLKEIRRKKKKMAKALKKAQRKSSQKFQIVKPVSFGVHKKINKNAYKQIVLPVKIPSLKSRMGKKNFYKLSQYCFRLQRKYLMNIIASKKQKKYDMLSTKGFYCFVFWANIFIERLFCQNLGI